ncbi:YjjG family noncanonical pyrimidine nucleotidase [Paenibacillus marinisediminis]
MKYPIILFDADETLFDFAATESFALTQTCKEIGIVCDEEQIASYKSINKQLWNELEKGLITSQVLRTERFRRWFAAHNWQSEFDAGGVSSSYIKYLAEGAFLIDGAVELCEQLLSAGYRLSIITNGIKEVQLGRIGRSQLQHTFEHIIISEVTGYQKPQTGIFDYAFDKMGIRDKQGVLMVGDSLSSDIQGGINYGIDTCWYNPQQNANPTTIVPNYEISKLSELLMYV